MSNKTYEEYLEDLKKIGFVGFDEAENYIFCLDNNKQ